jgi:hypothetical protein
LTGQAAIGALLGIRQPCRIRDPVNTIGYSQYILIVAYLGFLKGAGPPVDPFPPRNFLSAQSLDLSLPSISLPYILSFPILSPFKGSGYVLPPRKISKLQMRIGEIWRILENRKLSDTVNVCH